MDSFEEIFKLIFTKLYDELICANDITAYLKFRNHGDTDFELKEKNQDLFDDAFEYLMSKARKGKKDKGVPSLGYALS